MRLWPSCAMSSASACTPSMARTPPRPSPSGTFRPRRRATSTSLPSPPPPRASRSSALLAGCRGHRARSGRGQCGRERSEAISGWTARPDAQSELSVESCARCGTASRSTWSSACHLRESCRRRAATRWLPTSSASQAWGQRRSSRRRRRRCGSKGAYCPMRSGRSRTTTGLACAWRSSSSRPPRTDARARAARPRRLMHPRMRRRSVRRPLTFRSPASAPR
mmetsp:Transcript_37122/g.110845  ORF Transcript_37122/g.110845 Transcript_37122/m.110845 type:complete len:222 (+) Transcript_37122:1331-1996(+)